MEIEFGYGKGIQKVEVPDENLIDILLPNEIEYTEKGEEAVKKALANPIGSKRLKELVRRGEKVAIITSDISRPFPTAQVLPRVLEELKEGGVEEEDITLVFALGSHRKHTEEEKQYLAGEDCRQRIRCVDSDMEDCIRLGTTSRGTPVDITRVVAQAERIICLGNIEYHYFAGYSGGAKAIMPGVSSREAIQRNHSMMVDAKATAGNVEDNPVRLDIEEAGDMLGIDFIVNVVLDEKKKIVHCVAGDVKKAHRAGCSYLDKLFGKPIRETADIVLVSQGGEPKDINLYQTQKALDNAKYAVKDGGTIILIGACREGLGSAKLEQWLREAPDAHSMVERIEEQFELGGHKAAAIGMVLDRARIDLISEFEDSFVKSIFMYPQPSAQKAFDQAMERYGKEAKVIAMPFGGATLPIKYE